MKINDKNLCAFAISPTPVDREGWLNKRGDVNKSYQRRWFLLKGNLLFYFEKKTDKEPIGVIILEGCTVELAEDDEQFSFKVAFHGAQGRAYVLGADCQDSMEQWMKALACASYDYMKLMVAELQRQLDEMDELGAAAQEETASSITPKVPPRGQRYNPFNKIQEASSSKHSKAERPPENVPRTKITFRELHNLYGRKILADYNEWRRKQSQESEKSEEAPVTAEEPLILL